LLHGEGVTADPPGETFWKVANGIRMTGMPSFQQSLSQTQMWQISLMLANADKLPNSVRAVLAGQPETPTPTPAATVAHPTSRK
jgi:thiosulfate dehydrogenase